MNGYLVDTNVLSEFARPKGPDERVDRWLKTTPEATIFASVLSFAEIRRGIELLPPGKRRTDLEVWQGDLEAAFVGRLLAVTKPIADAWAKLSVQAQRSGRPLSIVDGLIAATAVERGLALVTRNVKDFETLGVLVLNPWEAERL